MDVVLEFLKILGGGVVAAVITLAINGRRLSADLERSARTIAIQLTDLFERFALDCAAIPGEHANSRRDNPFDYSGIAALPAVPDLPADDAGWRALETALAIDARTFGTRRKQSGDMINGTAEHGDADDIENEVEEQAAILGDAAWSLAARLRTRYGLGATHVNWEVSDHFAKEFERIEQRKARNAALAAEMWASIEAADKQGEAPSE